MPRPLRRGRALSPDPEVALTKQGLSGSLESCRARSTGSCTTTLGGRTAKDCITPSKLSILSPRRTERADTRQPCRSDEGAPVQGDKNGKVTRRYWGPSAPRRNWLGPPTERVTLLVHDRDARVVDENGELLRHLTTRPVATRA